MNSIKFNLAAEAVYEVLSNEKHLDPVDLATAVVQELVDSGLFPDNTKKLSAQDVREMRAAYKRGTSQVDISRQYGVNSATVSRIVRGIYH